MAQVYGGSVLKSFTLLMIGSSAGQVLKGSTTIYGYIGRDQILVQGYVDAGVQKADRQPEDESPSMDSLPPTFMIEHGACTDQWVCRVSTSLQTTALNLSRA